MGTQTFCARPSTDRSVSRFDRSTATRPRFGRGASANLQPSINSIATTPSIVRPALSSFERDPSMKGCLTRLTRVGGVAPIARPLAVSVDCSDPVRLATFWQQVVGGTIDPSPHDDDYLVIGDVPVVGLMAFQKVPERKQVKNRVHLDLDVQDIDAAVAASVALGATKVGDLVEEPMNFFQVMRDPEGNEFCFILHKPPADR